MNYNKLWRKRKCPICSNKLKSFKSKCKLYAFQFYCQNCNYEYREYYITRNNRLCSKTLRIMANGYRLYFTEEDKLSKGKKTKCIIYKPNAFHFNQAINIKTKFKESPTVQYFVNKLNNFILLS